ncbi:hypothetical protein SEVIR_5G435716v4 [Setaria viridis]
MIQGNWQQILQSWMHSACRQPIMHDDRGSLVRDPPRGAPKGRFFSDPAVLTCHGSIRRRGADRTRTPATSVAFFRRKETELRTDLRCFVLSCHLTRPQCMARRQGIGGHDGRTVIAGGRIVLRR